MSPSPSTRWCPTPEQLMILEELYERGLRTPNASQIQKITAHLAYYGKIQGKNVFYWFQNHKARDRQKLRKKLLHQHHLLQNYQINPQLQPSHIPHHHPFLAPSLHFQFQFPNFCSPQDQFHGHAPGNEVCEEVLETAMKPTWPSDVPKDWSMRSCGHDSTMVMGPSSPSRNRPLETLELFPLTPEKTTS